MISRPVFISVAFVVQAFLTHFAYALPRDDSGVLRGVNMETVIIELQNRGVKIALIQIPPDPSRAITLEQEAKIIEAIPEAQRTPREENLLDNFDQKRLPATCVVGYSGEDYNITLPDSFPSPAAAKEILEKVVALDSRYELVWSKDFPVICPRSDSVRNIRVKINLVDVSAFDAVLKLGEALGTSRLSLSISGEGPSFLKQMYGSNQVSLKFFNEPVIDALCRFAEALGPDYTWSILGIKGYGRNFGFGQVASPSH